MTDPGSNKGSMADQRGGGQKQTQQAEIKWTGQHNAAI